MHITETNADGLKREFKIVVPAGQIEDRVESKLKELAQTVQMPGFRPGKVPLPMLRKKYRASLMGEVLESEINSATEKAITDTGLRPAMQPKIEISSFADGKDLEFTVAMESLPEVEPVDFATIALDRPKVEIADAEIDTALSRIAERNEKSEPMPAEHKAETGDIAVINFVGKRNGEAFAGGSAENHSLKLGSGSFIPGFEEQLVGLAAGDEKTVPLTFPEQYHSAELAGQPVEFDVKVNEVRRAVPASIDDELAKTLGLDDLSALRTAVREQIEREYGSLSRTIIKRRLLDALASAHDFAVPQGMVDMEFDHIWKQIEEDKKNGRLDADDVGKDDDALKTEYRAIAERRVRLGLLLSEVGRRNSITVTQQDLNRAVVDEARRYPGQEGMVFQYYQKNPDAMEALKAPIYEEKVVDFVLELAKTTDVPVTPEELATLAEGTEKAQV